MWLRLPPHILQVTCPRPAAPHGKGVAKQAIDTVQHKPHLPYGDRLPTEQAPISRLTDNIRSVHPLLSWPIPVHGPPTAPVTGTKASHALSHAQTERLAPSQRGHHALSEHQQAIPIKRTHRFGDANRAPQPHRHATCHMGWTPSRLTCCHTLFGHDSPATCSELWPGGGSPISVNRTKNTQSTAKKPLWHARLKVGHPPSQSVPLRGTDWCGVRKRCAFAYFKRRTLQARLRVCE